jgi:hypothetical protein
VSWTTVKTELTFELGRLLHRKIHAHFDFVDVTCAVPPAVVDIDGLLVKEQADICILHDKHMVCVATFSPKVCSKTRSEAAENTNASVEFNDKFFRGIKAVGNSDVMQKCKEAVHTANHGAAMRPQPSTSHTELPQSTEVNEAVGCPRGGTSTPSPQAPQCFHSLPPHQSGICIVLSSHQSTTLPAWMKAMDGTRCEVTKNGRGCHILHQVTVWSNTMNSRCWLL